MKISRKLTLAALTCGLFLSAVPGMRAQQPDNSVQNKNQSTTADNQTNAKSDRMLAQQARKAIMLNGAVTLKGPVKSDDEKQKVASDVEAVAGPDKVTNQLTVKQ
jgi:hyperosmotically inducible protein